MICCVACCVWQQSKLYSTLTEDSAASQALPPDACSYPAKPPSGLDVSSEMRCYYDSVSRRSDDRSLMSDACANQTSTMHVGHSRTTLMNTSIKYTCSLQAIRRPLVLMITVTIERPATVSRFRPVPSPNITNA